MSDSLKLFLALPRAEFKHLTAEFNIYLKQPVCL